jgi:hypothetical protein
VLAQLLGDPLTEIVVDRLLASEQLLVAAVQADLDRDVVEGEQDLAAAVGQVDRDAADRQLDLVAARADEAVLAPPGGPGAALEDRRDQLGVQAADQLGEGVGVDPAAADQPARRIRRVAHPSVRVEHHEADLEQVEQRIDPLDVPERDAIAGHGNQDPSPCGTKPDVSM